jgi:hypothetical protein
MGLRSLLRRRDPDLFEQWGRLALDDFKSALEALDRPVYIAEADQLAQKALTKVKPSAEELRQLVTADPSLLEMRREDFLSYTPLEKGPYQLDQREVDLAEELRNGQALVLWLEDKVPHADDRLMAYGLGNGFIYHWEWLKQGLRWDSVLTELPVAASRFAGLDRDKEVWPMEETYAALMEKLAANRIAWVVRKEGRELVSAHNRLFGATLDQASDAATDAFRRNQAELAEAKAAFERPALNPLAAAPALPAATAPSLETEL